MPLNLPKRSGSCDPRAEQRAEERVTGGRRAERARARDEPRPGAVAPLRVDGVEEGDAGPEERVLDECRCHALLHAATAEPLEDEAERRARSGMCCEVGEPLVASPRDERADQLGVAVRRPGGALEQRV